MDDIKQIIAKNIIELRRRDGMTQAELAEKLSYTDKAVSKWERGASVPDISVLKNIAELFGVTVDYLITDEHPVIPKKQNDETRKRRLRNRGFITGMSILLVWLVAALAFVVIDFAAKDCTHHWLAFLYAVPASMIVWLVLNSIWFDLRRNFIIISCLMWTLLIVFHITLLSFGFNPWLIYILGIPGQAIIILWSRLRFKP